MTLPPWVAGAGGPEADQPGPEGPGGIPLGPDPSWPVAPPASGSPPPGYWMYGYGGYSYGGYPGYGPVRPTNGLAIASLLLAILLWGIGSVLGIILGLIALSSIKKSGGAEKGRGLAIAGISVGVGGIVLVIGMVITLVVVFAHVTRETVVPMGTTVNIANCGCGSSLANLTISNLTEAPNPGVSPASPGLQLWVAQVDACEVANSAEGGDDGPELFDLAAITANGTIYGPANQVPDGDINILYATLAPNQCVAGSVSFWIPDNQAPAGMQYTPDGPFARYEWKQA